MKKFMKKLAKKTEGFTLVELIVVIAILGILAGIAVPAYSGYLNKANEASSVIECDAVKTAAMAALATYGEVTEIEISKGTVTATYEDAAGTEHDVTLNGSAVANETYDDDFDMYYTSTVPSTFHGSYNAASWAGSDWTFSTVS